MPVKVTIQLPGAEHQLYIKNIGPTNDTEGTDPEGERLYEWRLIGEPDAGTVTHRRGDGWAALLERTFGCMRDGGI